MSAARLARSARAAGPLALWRSLSGPQCAHRVVRMSGEDGRPLIPNHEQCNQLLQECRQSSNQFVWSVAMICLATGARWIEAETLKNSGFVSGKVIFRDTKNGKSRAVPIDPKIQEQILEHALPGPGRLFGPCRSAFRSAYERCGYSTPQQLTHILRHTFASHYMMNGGDILTLQRILGHGNITMTMKYAHLSPDHLESAVRLSPASGLYVP